VTRLQRLHRAQRMTRLERLRRHERERRKALAAAITFSTWLNAGAAPFGVLATAESLASPAPAPVAADLSHIAYTATAGLTAQLIAPADRAVTAGDSAAFEVQTVVGAGVELKIGQDVIPATRIGKRVVDPVAGVTRYTYYGIVLSPGPNFVTLTPLGGGGVRGAVATHVIYGPGQPVSLALRVSGRMRADGMTSDEVEVVGRDQWGHHAAAGSVVRLTLTGGDARLETLAPAPTGSAAPATPAPGGSAAPVSGWYGARQGVDVTLGGEGEAVVKLLPGLKSGDVALRAQCGDVTGDDHFFLSPSLRRPFVTGLLTAGAGAVPGIPEAPNGAPNGTSSRRARIGFFATGAVGKSLATVAYDTADRLGNTPAGGFVSGSDAADRPYAITGDASIRQNDALSRDHLFARVDNGRFSALWGEFAARTSSATSVGGFDQLVDGAKVELAGATTHATAFTARNDVGYDRRVFSPTGLAQGVLLRPGIVVGSEQVILATLDRQTGAVIAQTILTRGIDYSLEYATGQIRFITIPLPFDQNFNPQTIVVTYEYDAPGSAAQTVGGRVETSVGGSKGVRLGVGYVNDSSGAGNVTLATQDVGGVLRGGSWSVSHATSSGSLPSVAGNALQTGNGGDALQAQLSMAGGPDRLSLAYQRTSNGYNNPFGGLTTPGLLDERVSFAHQYPGGLGDVELVASHQSNSGPDASGSETETSLRTRRNLSKRLAVTAELDHRSAASGTAAATTATPAPGTTASAFVTPANESSTQLALGADYRAASALDLSVNHIETLSGSNSTQPAQTNVQASLDIGGGGRAFVRELWSAAPVQSFAAATQSYTASTGGTHDTEFGIERHVTPTTTVETDYTIDHTASGQDVYESLGAHQSFTLGNAHGDAFVQHATAFDVSQTGFNLYGTTLNYADKAKLLTATASGQLRTGDQSGYSLMLAAIGAISPELSLYANIDDARSTTGFQADERLGLAWRPSRNDRGAALLQYDVNDGSSTLAPSESGVLSLEYLYRITHDTEVVGRYAYKLQGDSTYEAHSSLAALGLVQKIGSHFDVGAEARRSEVAGIVGSEAFGIAVEGGLRLTDRTRFALGYNASGSGDAALTGAPVRRGFYMTITSALDHILNWGR
jgi:hypothetical protein